MEKNTIILGIETSCDETAVAVVKMERKLLQMLLHHKLKVINVLAELYQRLRPVIM